ncbi:epimerase [Pseudonocardia sp. GCM10023141]|uniref:epimerase n=1 Tax=Pseudonocardia sp. GCM10023141 TaxID=3252653 RepID=UPI00360C6E23
MGRWLVLRGTLFLSRAVAAAAVARGHDVVCAARGESGGVPDGAKLVAVDRQRPDSLDALRGERFDAVVDVAKMSYPWVRDALAAIGPTAAHWTFVSSISAYAESDPHIPTLDAPLLEPLQASEFDEGMAGNAAAYGRIKVASENAVNESVGDRAFVVRAGLICGPGDRSDRFGYWPNRFARGGRAAVPAGRSQPAQIIDVRDLAEWIVRSGEERLTGTFDGSGPGSTLGAILDEVADAVGAPDLELVPFTDEALTAAGVDPWSGPSSMPLWIPMPDGAVLDRDTSPALAAGLRTRTIGDTARGALETEQELGLTRERRAGLSPADEERLLTPS